MRLYHNADWRCYCHKLLLVELDVDLKINAFVLQAMLLVSVMECMFINFTAFSV